MPILALSRVGRLDSQVCSKEGCLPPPTKKRSSGYGSAEMNLTSIHEDVGSIPGLAQWVKDLALL